MTLEAACRATLVHLEFRDGPLWTFVDPSNAHIVSPAFGAREEAKAWQAPYLEEREAAARAAEEAAARAAEEAAARAAEEGAQTE